MRPSLRILAAAALAALMSGCASNAAQRDAERLALYRSHAGQPVDSIQYFGRYNGWTPLGEGAFALWTRPSEAWLIELHAPCVEIDYADTIGFRDTNGRLNARFDQVYVGSRSLIPISCTIREIRPLDVKAIRADEKRLRDERKMRDVRPPAEAAAAPAAQASGT
jgi:hypothetical protein